MSVVRTPQHKAHLAAIEERLPEKKVEHVVSVTEFFLSFAAGIDVGEEQAIQSGLLHDLCRKLDDDTLLARARDYGLAVPREWKERPVMLHGPVAAEEARRDFGVEDDAVYEAIYWHTTGRAGLGRVGQGLFLADFAEPLRKYPEAAEARTILEGQGFDRALLYAVQGKLTMGKKKGSRTPDTEAFYAWLIKTLQ